MARVEPASFAQEFMASAGDNGVLLVATGTVATLGARLAMPCCCISDNGAHLQQGSMSTACLQEHICKFECTHACIALQHWQRHLVLPGHVLEDQCCLCKFLSACMQG